MRVLVFSERLRLPLDEGFKNTAINLVRALRQEHEVLALTTFGEDIPAEQVHNVAANKLLLSNPLRRAVQDFAPQVILYIPTASATPFAMLRTRVLHSYAPQAPIAMLALQPRAYDPVTRLVIRLIKPPLTIVQSSDMVTHLAGLGCRVSWVRGGVDAQRFSPVSLEERRRLRAQLGLPADGYVALHVGHINVGRNVGILAGIQKAGCQAVLVGSTSTEQDDQLAHRLAEAGVIVVRDYVSRVEEYYQAADCYVFPVTSATGAISVPLSILEAMACNLPVVTMPYGDLPALFPASGGLSVVRNDWELVSHVLAARQVRSANTRALVLPFSWPSVAREILQQVTVHP
jgi:glycosyltransferase involved in cell wall biosynthesis